MGGIPNVVINIAAQTAGAVRDINAVNSALGDQVSAGSKASSALKKAAVPAAAKAACQYGRRAHASRPVRSLPPFDFAAARLRSNLSG